NNDDGINLLIDAPDTGTLRDRTYHADEDATILDRLRELMGVDNGPEFTVDVDWADDSRRSIAKILRVRNRIGQDREHAVFDSRGDSGASYTLTEDYSDGRGATLVTATSTGEGDARPVATATSPRVDDGWPLVEYRWSPSTSID